MITLLLAWINVKYKWDYELLFVGTFILDGKIIEIIVQILKNKGII